MFAHINKAVVLREDRNEDGYYYLSAKINQDGDLLIEGQDLGPRVKEIFDCIEYEWVWTIRRPDIDILKSHFESQGNILGILKKHFANDKATSLFQFLCDNDIPFDIWSRTGD